MLRMLSIVIIFSRKLKCFYSDILYATCLWLVTCPSFIPSFGMDITSFHAFHILKIIPSIFRSHCLIHLMIDFVCIMGFFLFLWEMEW